MRARHAREGAVIVFKELLDSWRERAAGERTVKSYAVRLPIDDAARLGALAEMFPGRTTEQLITELLGAALKELAAAMPYVAGDQGDLGRRTGGPGVRGCRPDAALHGAHAQAPP